MPLLRGFRIFLTAVFAVRLCVVVLYPLHGEHGRRIILCGGAAGVCAAFVLPPAAADMVKGRGL